MFDSTMSLQYQTLDCCKNDHLSHEARHLGCGDGICASLGSAVEPHSSCDKLRKPESQAFNHEMDVFVSNASIRKASEN